MFTDVDAWLAELDRLADEPLMPEGREQPVTPEREVVFEDPPVTDASTG